MPSARPWLSTVFRGAQEFITATVMLGWALSQALSSALNQTPLGDGPIFI